MELFSTQMSVSCESWYSLVQGLVTYVVVLYVFLGLDFGWLKCFFEKLKIYLHVIICVYSKHFLSLFRFYEVFSQLIQFRGYVQGLDNFHGSRLVNNFRWTTSREVVHIGPNPLFYQCNFKPNWIIYRTINTFFPLFHNLPKPQRRFSPEAITKAIRSDFSPPVISRIPPFSPPVISPLTTNLVSPSWHIVFSSLN